MNKIYLIRHGETIWNRSGTWQGWTNVPLNERGIEQAKRCREALKNVKFHKILTSDLERAYVTAELIGKYHPELTVEKDEAMRELHFGEWEGLTFQEIEEKWPGKIEEMYTCAGTVKIPSGESFQELQDRSWKRLKESLDSLQDGENILVVCHGGTNRALICKLLKLDLNYAWNFRQGNTSITVIEYYGDSDFNTLNTLNDLHHLKDMEGTDLCG